MRSLLLSAAGLIILSACAAPEPKVDAATTMGSAPVLPAPAKDGLIPTMNTPKAGGWAAGAAPKAAPGLAASRFAEGLNHPRWLLVLPGGDVLAALSSTEPGKPKSIKDWVMQRIQKRVGALQESPDQIVLLRDANGDGAAEVKSVLISEGLNQPFGMAVMGDALFVGNTDAIVRFPFNPQTSQVTGPPEKVIDLPHGPGHWTRNLLVAPDGKSLFVTVGSASNIADGGMAAEEGRAAIWLVDPVAKTHRLFATGLRNPNGLAYAPGTTTLWTVVNERDLLGDNLVPDYLTSVQDGDWFGWPWFYWGTNRDDRVEIPANVRLREGRTPDYALGAHVAALGLAFHDGKGLPAAWQGGGAFIGEHGSWNRQTLSGYKVVFVPFAAGRPSGPPQDVLTGFLDGPSRTFGRPVGVAVAPDGALLVADDVGGIVWRVSHQP